MNPDFRDMLSALNDAGAEYLVVAAHSTVAELARVPPGARGSELLRFFATFQKPRPAVGAY